MEGHVVISNENNSAEITTGNGHRLSNGEVKINGQVYDFKSKVYDGKTYVDYNFIKEIEKLSVNNAYKMVSYSDISPERSYDNIGPLKLPV